MMNRIRLMGLAVVLASCTLFGGVGCRTTEVVEKSTQRSRGGGAPKIGDKAPLFTLKTLDRSRQVKLASFRGKRPVVLFFGSYT